MLLMLHNIVIIRAQIRVEHGNWVLIASVPPMIGPTSKHGYGQAEVANENNTRIRYQQLKLRRSR